MIKIARVVTSNYCIPAHLHNTLVRIPENYQYYVLGDNVTKYSESYKNVIFIDVPIPRDFSFFKDFYSFFSLAYNLFKIKPDIIHSIMTKAGVFSSILGKILFVNIRIHTFTGQVWVYKKGIVKKFYIFIDKLICYLNSDCITDSKSQSEFLYLNGIKKNSGQLNFLLKGSLSGVDLGRFNQKDNSTAINDLRVSLGFKNSDFILGYIARKSLDKGCMDMLNVFGIVLNSFPAVKLLFIGPDESNGLLTKFFDENPNILKNVVNLGFVHNHENYLGLINLLCLPSYREGFGSIVIDAAAMSVPTVGYQIPGLVDSIVNSLTGKLVSCGNVSDFANEVIMFIRDSQLLFQFSLNAKEYAVNYFNADLLNKELYNYYEKFYLS
jgi:glycosyltransferase involved in cell wall biosynthesis